MKRIYVVGNPAEPTDRLVPMLLPKLAKTFPDIRFVPYDPTEDLDTNEKEITLLDSVVGITKVTVFVDMNAFLVSPRVTAHDYDLPVALTMLLKLGKLKRVRIIGIPMGMKPKTALAELLPIVGSI